MRWWKAFMVSCAACFALLGALGAGTAMAAAPGVVSVAVPAASYYNLSAVLEFVVTFDQDVKADAGPTHTFPRLQLTIGSRTAYADFVTGPAAPTVRFAYLVRPGDVDLDGIAVEALDLNGASITNSGGEDADVALHNVGATSNVLVDGVQPRVTSVDVPADGEYGVGDQLDFTVHTSEPVRVLGTPTLSLDVGGTIVPASYVSGSGSDTLVFAHTVVAADHANHGIAVAPVIPTPGADAISDPAGNPIVPTLNGLPSTAGVVVNPAAQPTAVSLPGGRYATGATVPLTVGFDRAVTVDTTGGVPAITLHLASGDVSARYASGSGSTALTFQYVVAAGDEESSGATVDSAIRLNGGAITDAISSNPAQTTLPSATIAGAPVLVDGVAPQAQSIARLDANPTDGATSVRWRVTFSEPVTGVNGSDFMPIASGTATGAVSGVSTADNTVYDVTVGGVSGTGTLALDLVPASSGIRDRAGNALVDAFAGEAYDVGHRAETREPDGGQSGDDGQSDDDGQGDGGQAGAGGDHGGGSTEQPPSGGQAANGGQPAAPLDGGPAPTPSANRAPQARIATTALGRAAAAKPGAWRGERFRLDGSRSRDRDGHVRSWRWQLGGRTVSHGRTVTVTVRMPTQVVLAVTDDDGATSRARTVLRPHRPKRRTVSATIDGFGNLSARVAPSARAKLVALRHAARGAIALTVAGYTADTGADPAFNVRLSQRRAERVAALLLDGLGTLRPVHVAVVGRGGAHPVATNRTDAGQAANRRVVVRIVTDR
jgi:outer membrane protein OmpA-like peptidoglycan-associated protein